MNSPNPLIPQGSLEAHQYYKRSATKLVVSSILAVHGVVLGGLLFLGCKEEDPDGQLAGTNRSGFESVQTAGDTGTSGTRTYDSGSPFGDLLPTTNDPIASLLGNTNVGSGPFGTDGSLGASTNLAGSPFGRTTEPPLPGSLASNTTTGFPPVDNSGTSRPLVDEPETASGPVPYAVLPGDNFTTIAKKHGITVKAITAANPGVDSRRLKVGQKLNLPADVKAVTPAIPSDTPATGTANETLHTVASGDTLSKLSRDYKVSIKAIQRANGIRGATIYVGQKLIIPSGSSSGQ